MYKQPQPAPTASTIGLCPTIIQISRTPQHWKFTQHLRTTRPPPGNSIIFAVIQYAKLSCYTVDWLLHLSPLSYHFQSPQHQHSPASVQNMSRKVAIISTCSTIHAICLLTKRNIGMRLKIIVLQWAGKCSDL